jgi:hypothetical protein
MEWYVSVGRPRRRVIRAPAISSVQILQREKTNGFPIPYQIITAEKCVDRVLISKYQDVGLITW